VDAGADRVTYGEAEQVLLDVAKALNNVGPACRQRRSAPIRWLMPISP